MKTHYIAILILLLAGAGLRAQPVGTPAEAPVVARKSIFSALTEIDAAKLTIETDLTTLIANKKTNQYFPGALITENGKTYKIEIRPRGKYRRKIAEVPPLKIKFPKKSLVAEGLDTLNEIKVVLPAYDNDQGDELIIKEYLAYRMYELLSPVAIKARLVRLTIRDTHVEKTKKSMYAILVEDEEETAARLQGQEVEQYGIPTDSLSMNHAAMLAVFQYMIGNTDWEISMIRNIRLIRATETGKIFPIPYDFDFSGFVGAPYATPSSESGLRSVRDRFLMANGIRQDALKKATQQIKANRDGLYAICRSKYLSRDVSDNLISFLDTYFTQLSEKDEVPRLLKLPLAD